MDENWTNLQYVGATLHTAVGSGVRGNMCVYVRAGVIGSPPVCLAVRLPVCQLSVCLSSASMTLFFLSQLTLVDPVYD